MITGKILRDAVISGANNIINNRTGVDELNVFPVPDGDTGTNMSMTIGSAKKELEALGDDCTVGEVASVTAGCMLRGARGNSGVISSLLFRGFSRALKDRTSAETRDLKAALRKGVDSAYKAVMKPTEGTILTVARVACERAEARDIRDEVRLWRLVVESAEKALADTPKQLPVLEKAGVVDAGGQGLVFIFAGMLSVFRDGVIIEEKPREPEEGEFEPRGVYSREAQSHTTRDYRVDFVVHKNEKASADRLRAYFETIGDSVAVAEDGDIIKCYLHTPEPGKALTEAIAHGYMTGVKIENMARQVSELGEKGRGLEKQARDKASDSEFRYRAVDKNIPIGFVAVAAGEGIINMFKDLGADAVVTGGQTMNPSTDDILRAAQSVPARTVFVLPNNKNIIMAAEQAAKLADRRVLVLPTRTIPRGISAMLSYDPRLSARENAVNMDMAASGVSAGSVTFAARNSDFEGHKIKRGDILAMEGSRLAFVDRNARDAAVKLARQMMKKSSSFVTLIYGEGVSRREREEAREKIKKRAPKGCEVNVMDGGQPVYYYLISVE